MFPEDWASQQRTGVKKLGLPNGSSGRSRRRVFVEFSLPVELHPLPPRTPVVAKPERPDPASRRLIPCRQTLLNQTVPDVRPEYRRTFLLGAGRTPDMAPNR